jgi:predicted enzyme related to lactoylglutathione lyase
MPIIERHAPGSFNWFELATTDQSAAKEFYSQLFGYEIVDSPMGPGQVYTMFKLEGKDAAAAYGLSAEKLAQGMPPHWDIYISVENADETAAKIKSLGGTLIAPPFDAMTYGRMAVASDPTGGVFCIWQPLSHIGSRIAGPDGTVCWADLRTLDPEAASRFYAGVFGWEMVKTPNDPSNYMHIKNGETFIGGIPPAHYLPPNVPAHWLLTFMASDVDGTTAKAASLGGKVLMPPMEIPGTGRFSIVQDPQGAALSLFQPMAVQH